MERTLYFLRDKTSGEFIVDAYTTLGKFEDAVIFTSVKNTQVQLDKRNSRLKHDIVQTKELINNCQMDDWCFLGLTSEDSEVHLWEKLRKYEAIDLEIINVNIKI